MSAKSTIKTIGGVAGALAGIGAAATAYALAARPRMLRWGAEPEEVERVFTGDEFVLNPQIRATHAVTVHAPVEKVFPWLVFSKVGPFIGTNNHPTSVVDHRQGDQPCKAGAKSVFGSSNSPHKPVDEIRRT